ncbi:uncharacterized protein YALI1_F20931g [Yarrowia lipolytica]|uniref:Uncharacterized protein n=1 Tax=Yarrowia lipolytica TaxID=4952 RepID=A0A1D8NNN0_YARLL|nr:hypothetical protein YALI1_F20931g [Yarrowia lipolytica]
MSLLLRVENHRYSFRNDVTIHPRTRFSSVVTSQTWCSSLVRIGRVQDVDPFLFCQRQCSEPDIGDRRKPNTSRATARRGDSDGTTFVSFERQLQKLALLHVSGCAVLNEV